MTRLLGWLGIALVLVASVAFTALNGGQRVTLRLGVVTLYQVPLTVVAFGSLLTGMLVMLAASVHTDLKVRRILRQRLADEDEEEKSRIFVDRTQQDLFEQETAAKRDERDDHGTEGVRSGSSGAGSGSAPESARGTPRTPPPASPPIPEGPPAEEPAGRGASRSRPPAEPPPPPAEDPPGGSARPDRRPPTSDPGPPP